MIIKSTKEEQKQKLILRIENALKTLTVTYPQGIPPTYEGYVIT